MTHTEAVMKSKPASALKFIEYVGGAFIAGKTVVAYAADDKILLRAETVGGKRLKRSYVDERGQTHTIIVSDKSVTPEQFDELKDAWFAGVHRGNVRIVERALKWVGYDV